MQKHRNILRDTQHGQIQVELFLTHNYAELMVLSSICPIQQYGESVGNSEPRTAP